MFATGWRRLSHRDGLYDDLDPRPEHAEAVVQWQSRQISVHSFEDRGIARRGFRDGGLTCSLSVHH